MSVVVSDTSPLRALAHVGQLELLPHFFDRVLVPPAVVAELASPVGRLPPLDLRDIGFARIQAPREGPQLRELLERLDAGEAEALALALEIRADRVLIDEAAGRSVASELGLTVIGALGVLLLGKQDGLVPAIGPLLDRLESEIKFFISPALRADVLQRAGESA
jgi:hypothetical protein